MLHFDPLTRGSTILAALVTLSLPLGCSPGSGGVAPDPRALLQGESLEQVDGPAWVVFADKGSEGEEALGAAESLLHPRALARRSLNRPDGTRVDWRDLPVRPDYVDALEELGVRIRHVVPRLNAVSVESLGERHGEVAGLPFVQEIRPVAQRVQPELPELGPAPTAPRGTEELPVSPYDYGGGTWQVELVNAQLMHGVGLTGAGVVVGLADTGFRLTHEVLEPLQAQVIDEYDFLEDDPVVANETDEEDDVEQDFHGSAVLSTLAAKLDGTMVGIAPEASFLLAKTESVPLEEPFEEDTWIAGASWIEASGAHLMTTSLGWSDWYVPGDFDGATAVSTIFAEDLASSTGLLMINSAGNSGPGAGTILAPADAVSVVAAAAVGETGALAGFSSRGPTADGRTKPDLAAPGHQVTLARWDQPDGLMSGSGTSFAAPILAGVATLLVEAHPDWTRDELVAALKETASQAEAPDNDMGWGIVDGWAACGLRCSCRDEDADGFYAQDCGGEDCEDLDPSIAPDQEEVCNGVDDDCDGVVPLDESDTDGDGDRLCATDCDDEDPSVDGVDHDGDGTSLCDGDCADGDPGIAPDAEEIPYDGVDQDCSGSDLTDQDADGFDGGPAGEDCADLNPAIFPDPSPVDGIVPSSGGHELCSDGRDNDCDGLIGPEDPDCTQVSAEDTGSSVSTELASSGCTLQLGGASRVSWGMLLLSLLALGGLWGRRRC